MKKIILMLMILLIPIACFAQEELSGGLLNQIQAVKKNKPHLVVSFVEGNTIWLRVDMNGDSAKGGAVFSEADLRRHLGFFIKGRKFIEIQLGPKSVNTEFLDGLDFGLDDVEEFLKKAGAEHIKVVAMLNCEGCDPTLREWKRGEGYIKGGIE